MGPRVGVSSEPYYRSMAFRLSVLGGGAADAGELDHQRDHVADRVDSASGTLDSRSDDSASTPTILIDSGACRPRR